MKKYSLSFFLFISISICYGYNYETKYLQQKVDHFSYVTQDTFMQRYLINSDYFTPDNGTIFFYTGNEGPVESFSNNAGFLWEIAPQFNALVVFAEHRYYGMSLPYGDKSYYEKFKVLMGYLTSEQALADYAYLITYLKSSIPGAENVPVFSFGGSYGGMLSAWMRMKYPHIVNGAIASSAPMLQFQNLTPCEKFYEVVTQDFDKTSPNCSQSIRKSWTVMRNFADTENGSQFLTNTFKLCQSVDESNITDLFEWLADTWTNMAMTNYPYPTNFLQLIPAYPIDVACKYLNDPSVSDEELIFNIYKAASVFQNYSGDVNCFDLNNSDGPNFGIMGWRYQQCTEIVTPLCKTGTSDMFEPKPWNFTQFSESCWLAYNVMPDLFKTQIIYGGKNITASSNIIFTNGKLDPWHTGGILQSLSPSLIAIVMDDAAHHLDLRESNPNDPPSVVEARTEIKSWIRRWSTEARQISNEGSAAKSWTFANFKIILSCVWLVFGAQYYLFDFL